MTIEPEFEREPRPILEDLNLGPIGDGAYGASATTPRVPLAAIAWTLLIVVLGAAVASVVGAMKAVPAPFGLAHDGLIAWAFDGDIFLGDPHSGLSRVAVGTADIDRNPVFSRDGTRLAFFRQVPSETWKFDLVVTAADGSDPMVLTPVPIRMPRVVVWAADGDSLLVNDEDGRMARYFTDGTAPRPILDGVYLEPDALRPPDGSQLLYVRKDDPDALYVMNVDGSDVWPVFGPVADSCVCRLAGPARWSPDGRAIVLPIAADGGQARVELLSLDGGGPRRLTDEDGTWMENDPAWSPDGSRIAFNRWHLDGAGDWRVRSVAVEPLAGGPPTPVGVAPVAQGALIDWSPDGSTILSLPATLIDAFSRSPNADGSVARPVLIDPASGTSRQFDWSVGSIASWQRLTR